MRSVLISIVAGALGVAIITSSGVKASNAPQSGQVARASADEFARTVMNRYCESCHNDRLKTAGFSLDAVDLSQIGAHPERWEQVVR